MLDQCVKAGTCTLNVKVENDMYSRLVNSVFHTYMYTLLLLTYIHVWDNMILMKIYRFHFLMIPQCTCTCRYKDVEIHVHW